MNPPLVAVIPARWASTRLPGKPLLRIGGIPMIVRTWQRVAACPELDDVVVATDDQRIAEAVGKWGGKALLTSPDHHAGTDRVAEAAESYPGAGILNVQGDEPGIDPRDLSLLASWFRSGRGEIGTLVAPLLEMDAFFDPAVVKVVTDDDGSALYFSRAPIPWPRGWGRPGRRPIPGTPVPPGLLRHLGVYLYRPGVVGRLAAMVPSPLERAESLEQLRALQARMTIACVGAGHPARGIDTPADLRRARRECK